jgi:hypothetical protein
MYSMTWAGRAEVDHFVKPPPSKGQRRRPTLGQVCPPLPEGVRPAYQVYSKEAFRDPGDLTTFDDGIEAGQEA